MQAAGELHNQRILSYARILSVALLASEAKFIVAVSAADAAWAAGEAGCCGLRPAAPACMVPVDVAYWNASSAASWNLLTEHGLAFTAYFSACGDSERTVLITWDQQIDLWHQKCTAANPPQGVIRPREEFIAGEEPTPPQTVEAFLE